MQEEHPIAYESQYLNYTGRCYIMQKKKMATIIHYRRMWRHYFLGRKFIILSSQHLWLENGTILNTENQVSVSKLWNLQKEIIQESHDIKWASHPRIARTLALVQNYYYWSNMQDDVEAYVRTCFVQEHDKVKQQHPVGLREPKLIGKRLWKSVFMDFIMVLQKSDRCRSIMVIFYRFNKYATFILALTDCKVDKSTCLFLNNSMKLCAVPRSIINDRDQCFTWIFWLELLKLFGI